MNTGNISIGQRQGADKDRVQALKTELSPVSIQTHATQALALLEK